MPKSQSEVDQFMAKLKHSRKSEIEKIRKLVLAANKNLTEHIKWNAPSFCINGEDRITFRLQPGDRVELVFHRGAKVRAKDGFKFDDKSGLLKWPAYDRATATFDSPAVISRNQGKLKKLVNQWLKATPAPCEPKKVDEFDYSGLSSDFSKLSKPAKRALINRGILTPSKLARKSLDEIKQLHGMGPASFPILSAVLRKHGLKFRK